MDRLDIINYLIEKNGYKKYCNIGVFTGYTLDGVKCEEKIGVDPQPEHYNGKEEVIASTSDEFFERLPDNEIYDIFFIDGMHKQDYVERDIKNAIRHLSENGIIVLHDCNPPTEIHTTIGDEHGNWNGTVYKAVLGATNKYPGFDFNVIDTDWGVGILKKIPQPKNSFTIYQDIPEIQDTSKFSLIMVDFQDYEKAESDWIFFDKNRKGLLHIIPLEGFLRSY